MGLSKQRYMQAHTRPSGPARSMNLAQFNHWIDKVAAGKWGWIPEHKKIGAHIRVQHRERIRRHVGADGRPWATTYSKPRPKVGDVAPMIVEDRSKPIIVQKIKTSRGRKRAVAFRKRFGPPFKPAPALVRTRKIIGGRKTTWLRDFLVGSGFVGRALRITKRTLEYGFTAGTRWIETLQYGGRSKRYGGAPITPREVVGLNETDLKVIENIYADGYLKRVMS